MSFINSCQSKSDPYKLNNSLITKSGIYLIGTTLNNIPSGIIIKTDFNGNISWEHLFSPTDDGEIGCKFDCAIELSNGDLLVSGYIDELKNDLLLTHRVYLLCIDSNGVIKWTKKYNIIDDYGSLSVQISKGEFSHLYIAINEIFFYDGNVVTLIKMDNDGNIIKSVNLSVNSINDLFYTDNGEVYALGQTYDLKGYVTIFDNNLNLTDYKVTFYNNEINQLQPLKIYYSNLDYKIKIVGEALENSIPKIFVTCFGSEDISSTYSLFNINSKSSVINNSHIYIQYYMNNISYVMKLNNLLSIELNKNFDYQNRYIYITQTKDNKILFNSNDYNSIFGVSNLNFDSCISSQAISAPIFTQNDFIINYNTNISASEDTFNFESTDFSLSHTSSLVGEICPVVGIFIIQNNTSALPLIREIHVTNLEIGTLKIQNTTDSSISVNSGTIIAQANGIYFSLKDNTIFTAGSTTDVIVLANGKPEAEGNFAPIIFLYEVQNPYNFAIEFNVLPNTQQIDPTRAKLQSPDFYLQAVGSNGDRATKGIHLRWEFGGDLGENHIPKGNLAKTSNFYNKTNDFVTVYRVPYNKITFTIDFSKSPDFIHPLKNYWIYKFDNNRSIYIYFRDVNSFKKALYSVSPQTNPLQFIQVYGGVLEIENKADLFFGAELEISNKGADASLQLEGLSLAKQDTYNTKVLSYRKLFKSTDLASSPKFQIENGRSIRFRAKDCQVSKIHFEYYLDFILEANKIGWKNIGEYSLSLDDNLAFSRLEPNTTDNRVHGKWQKYNDDQFVNINNYKHKWNGISDDNTWERSIKKTVEKYLELSETDSKALEKFNFNQVQPNLSNDDAGYESYSEEDDKVSNLDLLKLAALDFHVARMLGMGTMDVDVDVFSSEYIYLAIYDGKFSSGVGGYESNSIDGENGGVGLYLLDYVTEDNIINENIVEDSDLTKLISMSLPTSINTERLPLSIDISEIKYGLPKENTEKSDLYDENGYTKDGKKRVVSIYTKEPFKHEVYPPFFNTFQEFDASMFTLPIYAGLEHKYYKIAQSTINWQKPELSHDSEYYVYGSSEIKETIPIMLPNEEKALYVHFHNLKGKYYYASYGIDWFSRASNVSNFASSSQVKIVTTDVKPTNTLLPPTGINTLLIKEEKPLMFTSVSEQERLKSIQSSDNDKTLVRLLFDYNAEQDIKIYNIEKDDTLLSVKDTIFPDDEEVFANQVEIFYRSTTPKNITAKVESLANISNNILLMQASTVSYNMFSTGEIFESKYPDGVNNQNFVGGIFLMNQQTYVIHSIEPGTINLKFNLYKKEASDILLSGKYADLSVNALHNKLLLEITELTSINNIDIGDGLFVANENMQTSSNWGSKNPNQLKIKLGNADWTVNRELITVTSEDGNVQNFIEKTRGFWKEATINKYLEDHKLINDEGKYIDLNGNIVDVPVVKQVHKGIYKIEFNNFKLPQHEQFSSNAKSVEWFNGFVRLFKANNLVNDTYTESRTLLKVFRTENIGDASKNLVLYIIDENFKFDYKTGVPASTNTEFLLGNDILVNYYPSYKVYLYSDTANDLIEPAIYGNKDTNYSIFGLRSIDTVNNLDYASRFSPPSVLLAQKTIAPQKPKKTKGALYTTRPDFYGKATYTFHVEFESKPFAVQFYRADDNSLLNALYTKEKIEEINSELDKLGGKNEVNFAERWLDFLNYDGKVNYESFPKTGEFTYALPLPNEAELYQNINLFIEQHNAYYKIPNTVNPQLTSSQFGKITFDTVIIQEVPGKTTSLYFRDFVKEYLYSVFLPLTEVPVVYEQIYGGDYIPNNKKQNIRDKDGILLKPKSTQKDANGFLIKSSGDEFEMAPMMKGIADKKVSFTDFTIDATTDSFYFYVAREIGSTMKLGEFSPFIGPVKVVDANAPEAPKINSALPILANNVLGITPKIKIEIHAYPEIHKIKRINLYRTTDRINAQAIMHMDLVKTIDVSDISDSNFWTIYDEFDSYDKVPLGDTLYYRVTVEKKIEYAKADYVTGGENPEIVIDYVPSQASKIISTIVVESQTPESPTPKFVTDEVLENATSINSGTITWNHSLYKGKYHLYKMSAQGNWVEIAKLEINSSNPNQFILHRLDNGIWNQLEIMEVNGNEAYISLNQLNLLPLLIKDAQGNKIYHHFKIMAENSSNMFSTQENILTIFHSANASGVEGDGIGNMIIGETFIVK